MRRSRLPADPAVVAAIAAASGLGRKAFADGRKCVPAHDPALCALICEHGAGRPFGSSLPLLKAWTRAWTLANLAAPVPGL